MSNPMSTLETDLAILAVPTVPPPTSGGGTAAATPLLGAVGDLFSTLEGVGEGIGTAIQTVAGDIDTALGAAAQALEAIAGTLGTLTQAATQAGSDAATVLASLQNALSTAQSLLPGGQSVTSALQSGSQFFGMLSSLLTDAGSIAEATTTLYEIAQQLRAIGHALS